MQSDHCRKCRQTRCYLICLTEDRAARAAECSVFCLRNSVRPSREIAWRPRGVWMSVHLSPVSLLAVTAGNAAVGGGGGAMPLVAGAVPVVYFHHKTQRHFPQYFWGKKCVLWCRKYGIMRWLPVWSIFQEVCYAKKVFRRA